MKCGACGSISPTGDVCKWCSKPLLVKPRAPTTREADRSKYGRPSPKRRCEDAQHFNRQPYMDDLHRRANEYCAVHNISPGKFGIMIKYPTIMETLRNGSMLRAGTKQKLERVLAS